MPQRSSNLGARAAAHYNKTTKKTGAGIPHRAFPSVRADHIHVVSQRKKKRKSGRIERELFSGVEAVEDWQRSLNLLDKAENIK